MHDHFNELLEWDEHGNKRRKKQVLPDGATTHFPMQMMDSAAGFRRTFTDGSIDHSHWSRPGFRVPDTSDEAKLAADAAYEERRARLRMRGAGTRDIGTPFTTTGGPHSTNWSSARSAPMRLATPACAMRGAMAEHSYDVIDEDDGMEIARP